jgi:hypothetical protein
MGLRICLHSRLHAAAKALEPWAVDWPSNAKLIEVQHTPPWLAQQPQQMHGSVTAAAVLQPLLLLVPLLHQSPLPLPSIATATAAAALWSCRSEVDLPDVLPFTAWDLVELLRLDRHPPLLAAVQQLLPQEGESSVDG